MANKDEVNLDLVEFVRSAFRLPAVTEAVIEAEAKQIGDNLQTWVDKCEAEREGERIREWAKKVIADRKAKGTNNE